MAINSLSEIEKQKLGMLMPTFSSFANDPANRSPYNASSYKQASLQGAPAVRRKKKEEERKAIPLSDQQKTPNRYSPTRAGTTFTHPNGAVTPTETRGKYGVPNYWDLPKKERARIAEEARRKTQGGLWNPEVDEAYAIPDADAPNTPKPQSKKPSLGTRLKNEAVGIGQDLYDGAMAVSDAMVVPGALAGWIQNPEEGLVKNTSQAIDKAGQTLDPALRLGARALGGAASAVDRGLFGYEKPVDGYTGATNLIGDFAPTKEEQEKLASDVDKYQKEFYRQSPYQDLMNTLPELREQGLSLDQIEKNLDSMKDIMPPEIYSGGKEILAHERKKNKTGPVDDAQINGVAQNVANKANGKGDATGHVDSSIPGKEDIIKSASEGAISKAGEDSWVRKHSYDHWYDDDIFSRSMVLMGLNIMDGLSRSEVYNNATQSFEEGVRKQKRQSMATDLESQGYPRPNIDQWIEDGDAKHLVKPKAVERWTLSNDGRALINTTTGDMKANPLYEKAGNFFVSTYKDDVGNNWGITKDGRQIKLEGDLKADVSASSSPFAPSAKGGKGGGSGGGTAEERKAAGRGLISEVAGRNVMANLRKAEEELAGSKFTGLDAYNTLLNSVLMGSGNIAGIYFDEKVKSQYPALATYATTLNQVLTPMLRADSGATLTDPEVMRDVLSYGPRPGDPEDVAAQRMSQMAIRALSLVRQGDDYQAKAAAQALSDLQLGYVDDIRLTSEGPAILHNGQWYNMYQAYNQ